MIVLGIAALILAGVLIAVPALQRNQRNNNRRADISYVQARIVQFQGDNNGQMPQTAANMASAVGSDDDSVYYAATNSWLTWNLEAGGASPADGAANEYNIWVDNGDATSATIDTDHDPGRATAAGDADPLPDEDHFDVFIGYQCETPALTAPTAGASNTPVYPNHTSNAFQAGGAVANQFVDEAGPSRGYAIVYKLEAQDVWRCIDNS